MKMYGKTVRLPLGLTLPDDIGDLGEDITRLDLSGMGLIGKGVDPDLCLMTSSGNIPETIGNLTNLGRLDLHGNQLSGYVLAYIQICAP
jgi:hypothetical protein